MVAPAHTDGRGGRFGKGSEPIDEAVAVSGLVSGEPVPPPRERCAYLDLLKVLASFAVVLIHVCAASFSCYELGDGGWQVANALDSLSRWCVPVFLMVTGALLLEPKKDVSQSELFRRRIPSLVLLYFLWSFVYALRSVVVGGWAGALAFVSSVVAGEYHLWYLPMLLGVYLLVPVLRALAANNRLLAYSCGLFCLAIVLNLCGIVAFGRGFRLTELITDLNFSPVYAGYSLLGCCLYRMTGERAEKIYRFCCWLLPLCLVFTVGGTYALSIRAGADDYSLYGYLLPNTLVPAVWVFLAARLRLQGWSSSAAHTLQVVASCSLGIYLIHPLLLFCSQGAAEVVMRRLGPVGIVGWSAALWFASLVPVLAWHRALTGRSLGERGQK